MTTGYISIGSNTDKENHIPSGLQSLRKLFGKLYVSSIYETEAIGFAGDRFHNLIVQFESELSAKQVAQLLRQLEFDHGRSMESQKFSSRTLDLDLILYGKQVINDGGLRIPRDEIERYAFVLEPLAELAPNGAHPVSRQSYARLWQDFDKRGLKQIKVYPAWLSNVQSAIAINS